MGWDDEMRDLKLKDQVHVRSGDGRRGWDRTMRWEILKQKDQVHIRSGGGRGRWDEMMRRKILNNWPSSLTFWSRMTRMGWDDEMRVKTIDQLHVLSRDRWRGWDGMIRWEILKQLNKFTYSLETDEKNEMVRWEVLKQLIEFTYVLETDEEDGMGWSDERS